MNARMICAAEQGPKQESIQDWNIRRLLIVIEIRRALKKKSIGFTKMLFLYEGWTWKILWYTAMADSAIDWKVIIFSDRCVFRGNVLHWKWYSFVLKV